ncbi:MAG: DMT family transporter [Synergistales bacterium]|nr:DMT family transporter [Synergistales bacterium]
MVGIAAFWGAGFGASHWLLGYVSPLWLIAVRFLISGGILVAIFWRRLRWVEPRDLLLASALGVLVAGTYLAHIIGLSITTPGKQSFIQGANVVMVPFLFALIYKRRPSWFAFSGAALTTAGLFIMAFTPGMSFNVGDLYSLLLALGIALDVLAIGYLCRRMDPLSLAVVQIAAAGVVLLVVAAIFEPCPNLLAFAPRVWGGILFVVIIVTVLPFLAQPMAMRFSPETHAAIILSLESPMGYIEAVMMGQEALNLQVVVGGLVILGGVVVAEMETWFRKYWTHP